MNTWGDREVFQPENEEKGWAQACLVMSLVLFAILLVLVVIGVAVVVIIGLLL